MKKYLISLIGLILLIPLGIQAQTIEDYLREASENNPKLKSAFIDFETSLTRVSQVNALPDPTISFGVFISPIETRLGAQRAKVSLSQMFPWFGTLQAKENVATLQAEVKYQEFLNIKNQLFFDVKKAYYTIYELHSHIKLMKQYLTILESYKQLAITSVSNGKGALTDVIRVDIIIDDLKTDIKLSTIELNPSSVSFNRLLNNSDTSIVLFVDSLNVFPIGDFYRKDSLLIANPKLNAINSQIEVANAMVTLAKKNGLPKFGIGLDYAFINERTDVNITDNGRNAIMPMATMSLPVFRGKYKASVEEAQMMGTSLEYKKKSYENTLFSAYETTMFKLKNEQQFTALYLNQIKKTEQMVDLLYVSYSNTGKDFEEVLRMHQELIKYQIALESARVKFYIAFAQLNYITSKS